MPHQKPPRAQSERQVWNSSSYHKRKRSAVVALVSFLLIFSLVGLGVWGAAALLDDSEGTEGVPSQPGEPADAGGAGANLKENGERYVLVLDAGHGGVDTGAQNKAGTINEADVTPVMVQKLADRLAAHGDSIELVFTRQEDIFLKPAERAEIAKKAGADLFLSLHLNQNNDSSVRGFQVFAQPPALGTHAESMRAAEILRNKVQQSLSIPIIGDTGIYYMFYVPKGEDSYTETPYDSAWDILYDHREAPTYGVLQKSGVPALLVEMWHLTNESDMNALYNEAGMDAMADVLYQTVLEYFGIA